MIDILVFILGGVLIGGLAALLMLRKPRGEEFVAAVATMLSHQQTQFSNTLASQQTQFSNTLTPLRERLKVIEEANKSIEQLSSHVFSFQQTLSGGPTRGRLGEDMLETIIRDSGLPAACYHFQHSLKTGARVDCLIKLPPPRDEAISVDAKFHHLSDYRRWKEAGNRNEQDSIWRELERAALILVKDIADKYIVPGETYEKAIMFVPSEGVYDAFEGSQVLRKAWEKNVMICSPRTLMLTLHNITALYRDRNIREQAHRIQDEVRKLAGDTGRLEERARKLDQHFKAAEEDVKQILTSAEKVGKRGKTLTSPSFLSDGGAAPALSSTPDEGSDEGDAT